MVTYNRGGKLIIVIEGNVDDMLRSIAFSQRRINRLQSDPPAKGHWWPRFLHWWCGVPETKEDNHA